MKRWGRVPRGRGEVGGGNHAQDENVTAGTKVEQKKRERKREGGRKAV